MEHSGNPAAGRLVKVLRWWGPRGALGLEDARCNPGPACLRPNPHPVWAGHRDTDLIIWGGGQSIPQTPLERCTHLFVFGTGKRAWTDKFHTFTYVPELLITRALGPQQGRDCLCFPVARSEPPSRWE